MRRSGILLLLVAGTFDAEPLYVTGAALVLLGFGAIVWIGLGGMGATLGRELTARSVVEEQPLQVKIHAKSGRLPLPPGWIDEPLLPEPVRLPAGRRDARVRIEVTFGRRGRRRLPPPALVLRDPFGLAQRVIGGPATDEVLVLPKIYPVQVNAGGGDATPAHARASLLAAAETELDGLRPMREGSPASRIHWQSLARGAGLMERKLIAEADSRPLVVLDPRAPSSPDALDAAVRAVASLTIHFAKRTGCGLLLPGDRRAAAIDQRPADAGPAAHVRLALMDDAVGPSLAAAQNRRGLIVYVAARPVDRAPRGLGRTPGGCLVVVPGAMPGRRALLEVAGCFAYVVRAKRGRRRRGGTGGGRLAVAAATAPAPAAAPAPRVGSGDADLLFSLPLARGLAFAALASWGALHWMSMMQPAEPGRGWAVVGVGLLAMFAMLLAGRQRGRRRTLFAVVSLIPLTALMLLAGGARDELLRPDNWSELISGISRGISDLPGVRVPYEGIDPWLKFIIPRAAARSCWSPPCWRSGRAAAAWVTPAPRCWR